MSEQQSRFEGWAETTKAYVSGLFDGEGCVYITRKRSTGVSPSFGVHVSLSNVDGRATDLLKQLFGGYVKKHIEIRKNHRDTYCWQLSGTKMACKFLALIRPYSLIKGEQIDFALDFASTIKHGPWVLAPEEIQRREECRQTLMRMKKVA